MSSLILSSLPSAFAISVVLWLGDPFSTGHATVSSELIATATGVPSISQQERKVDIPKAKSVFVDSICLLVVAALHFPQRSFNLVGFFLVSEWPFLPQVLSSYTCLHLPFSASFRSSVAPVGVV